MTIEKLSLLFLLFITYSFIGWCMEVGCKLVELKKFINRGFLIGPYCPIYGWGCILIIILLNKYTNDPLVLFIMAIVICSILEYFTSYFMEKLFKARWWDYSRRKFNINGRICLETMIPFGLLGCLIMYFVNPFFVSIYSKIPSNILIIISSVLFTIFLTDNIISYTIMFKMKIPKIKISKDSTEEITEYVRSILAKRSFLYKRLMKAYPNMKILRNNVMSINNDIDNINQY